MNPSNHETLKKWEELRKSKDTNEKKVTEGVFTKMLAHIEQGKVACNELVKLFKDFSTLFRENSKEINKLTIVANERNHYGSSQNVIISLKKQISSMARISEEHSKVFSDSIGSPLSNLASDYIKESNEIIEGGKQLGSNLEMIRDGVGKAFVNYCTAFDDSIKKTPSKDPWLLEQVYKQCVKTLKVEKDKYTQEMGKLFERFLKLEERRVEATKTIMHLYISRQKLIFNKYLESLTELTKPVDQVNAVADRQVLIKENFSRRSTELPPQTQQPAHQDPVLNDLLASFVVDDPPLSVAPTFTGYLFRQSSVMKSWKKNYFVLTSGFLHYFGSPDDILSNAPETTISLSQISVQHLTASEHEPNVFELITNPGAFFGSGRYVFRAESETNMVDWIVAIKKCAGNVK